MLVKSVTTGNILQLNYISYELVKNISETITLRNSIIFNEKSEREKERERECVLKKYTFKDHIIVDTVP